MPTPQISPAEQELAELSERFAHWRATRANAQARIPEGLWEEAIRVSTRVPNSRVAKTLHLSPGQLKRRRLAQQRAGATEALEATPNFVELTPVWPLPEVSTDTATEVELERPDGARLRIRYRQSPPSLAQLMTSFLEQP